MSLDGVAALECGDPSSQSYSMPRFLEVVSGSTGIPFIETRTGHTIEPIRKRSLLVLPAAMNRLDLTIISAASHFFEVNPKMDFFQILGFSLQIKLARDTSLPTLSHPSQVITDTHPVYACSSHPATSRRFIRGPCQIRQRAHANLL